MNRLSLAWQAFRSWRLRYQFLSVLLVAGSALAVAGWMELSRIVDQTLEEGRTGSGATIYSAPTSLIVGDAITPGAVAALLQRAGYTESSSNPAGWYALQGDVLAVHPGTQSYFQAEPVAVRFAAGRIESLTALRNNAKVDEYMLEPIPLAMVGPAGMQSQKTVRFEDIPRSLVQAILSAEDKHFFTHPGLDPLRLAKAAYVDFRAGRKEQGGSTLTMQLARNLFLEPDKNWRRKAQEVLITLALEVKLSKREIFERYVNQVYLGRRNGADMLGFAEAAGYFFGKPLKDLTPAESALLAGVVQRPSYFDPVRRSDRAVERRNLVLGLMERNGYLSAAARQQAQAEVLRLTPSREQVDEAPYFLALARQELQAKEAGSAARVYTMLDATLQGFAEKAVQTGMTEVDQRIKQRDRQAPLPQVALLALDPHTGEVKAAVGGRDFGMSQLNHITAKRQPGSIFKGLVYAAALGGGGANASSFTPASMLMDAPTVFRFGSVAYQPGNFHHGYQGQVTLRQALAKSLNIPAVQLAEKVGLKQVVNLAREAGLNEDIKATPAVALGAYEATALEMASAYTMFANQGVHVQPRFVSEARARSGKVIYRSAPQEHAVLTPASAFLMQDMLREVLRSGTAASVRGRGFTEEAAGKTGTSRDGWFVGFTADLLCIVWVGYDDGRDLDLEGAKSALPVWTEFMKQAAAHRAPGRLSSAPAGVVTARIDADTGLLAGPDCIRVRTEYFLAGSVPQAPCAHESMLPEMETTALYEPTAFRREE